LLLDLLGEDSFRARTYDNAARMLEAQAEPLDALIAQNRLQQIKGIGPGIASALIEISSRGTFSDLDAAQQKVPPGVLDLLRIEGLGVKKARVLWKEGRVTSLDELESALHQDIVSRLPGFGAKTAEKFRISLEFLKTVSGRHLRHHADRAAEAVRQSLAAIPGIQEVFFGGSLRRCLETVGDLDVLVIALPDALSSVRRSIEQHSGFTWTDTGPILRGATAARFPVELSLIPPQQAALRKVIVTGSKDHVRALLAIAARRGVDPEQLPAQSEQDVYSALGLEYVPPALRESADTVVAAGSCTFPTPVALSDIRGILHCHTPASDGHSTLRELVTAMIDKGYEYLGIADHSQAAAYAHGLTPDRVRAQWKEIDELNREVAPFRVLKGTEVDIHADGRLDFDDDLLAGFDFVIASIHTGFAMTEDEATNRLCRALENPHVDILGHATGRLLLERIGYPVNHERLIECAARHGKAIELNSNPHRLDLDWRWLAQCEAARVPVPLNPDAHIVDGLWEIRYGVEVAAKGPLTAANCPSTWPVDTFLNWCNIHTRET
jgi:DNA polymerase (family 10)